MKKIQEGQSELVNDTCNDCGSYADIGAVIDEFDTVLTLVREGDKAQSELQALAEAAKQRFEGVKSDIKAVEAGLELRLTFGYSAEKMIFQLEHGL
ncbi:YfcZ/YiiS family protein [Shewanella alkalitolerans]|uniref:DUF406 family protein n=1 Tax=Shewanella alkalitolerans TaxID=2864209 RepID=UPI001C657F63|nr:DUF406 family protein [Shewanella alkalitolerans]QYJ96010.1 YfcZ/YiiS family protein [Shewanella alkalitolerans]